MRMAGARSQHRIHLYNEFSSFAVAAATDAADPASFRQSVAETFSAVIKLNEIIFAVFGCVCVRIRNCYTESNRNWFWRRKTNAFIFSQRKFAVPFIYLFLFGLFGSTQRNDDFRLFDFSIRIRLNQCTDEAIWIFGIGKIVSCELRNANSSENRMLETPARVLDDLAAAGNCGSIEIESKIKQ